MHVKIIGLVFLLIGGLRAAESESDIALTRNLAGIRYQVSRIESQSTNKVAELTALATESEVLIASYPDRPEPLVWKGIILAARAKYVGLSALGLVDQARMLLEKAIAIDPATCDAAGLNALGMLYHKVPGWPISFGSNKKARAYFDRALAASANLDTHFRMGEFLLDLGEKEKGLSHLRTALAFPDRPGRPEDVLKKQAIRAMIDQNETKK